MSFYIDAHLQQQAAIHVNFYWDELDTIQKLTKDIVQICGRDG